MTRTVIDGNAFYEIDEECMERKKRKGEGKGEPRGFGYGQRPGKGPRKSSQDAGSRQ